MGAIPQNPPNRHKSTRWPCRPWYTTKVTPTFTDMLGALRLQMWEYTTYGESGDEPPSPEYVQRLLHRLAAVG